MKSHVKSKLIPATLLALCTGFGGSASAQDAAPSGPNAPLMAATSVKQFIQALPEWNAANPHKDDVNQPDAPEVTDGKDPNGRAAKVTRTHVNLADTPQEVVTCQPVNGFWLGALIQGKGLGLGLGSMQPIRVPVTKRAPLLITAFGHSVRVLQPSSSSAEAAIGKLIGMAGDNTGGDRTLSIQDDQDESQVAHSLGLEVSYLPAKVQASLKTSNGSSTHTAIAMFTESAFTAKLDLGDHSAKKSFFNENFDVASAKKLVSRGEVGMDNLPTFINSITYGRVVIFKLTSTMTTDEIKADLGGGGKLPSGVGVGGSVGDDEKKKQQSVTLEVTSFGGLEGSFHTLVPETKGNLDDVFAIMNKYLTEPAPLSSMVPISYTLNSLRDPTELASAQVTTDYTLTTYTPNAIGAKYKIWATAEGMGRTSDPYDVFGTLTVNGDTWWTLPESAAKSWGQGQPLNVTEDGAHTKPLRRTFEITRVDADPDTNLHMDLILTQHGNFLTGDYPIGHWTVNIPESNLAALSRKPNGQELTNHWHDNSSHATTLHVAVEKIGDV